MSAFSGHHASPVQRFACDLSAGLLPGVYAQALRGLATPHSSFTAFLKGRKKPRLSLADFSL